MEYEELPAVYDPVAALAPDAPLVHDVISVYEAPPNPIIRPVDGTNLMNHMRVRHGDVEQGFAESDLIYEDVFEQSALHHCALEPHVTVAQWEDDHLTVWSSTQMPYFVRPAVGRSVQGAAGAGAGAGVHAGRRVWGEDVLPYGAADGGAGLEGGAAGQADAGACRGVRHDDEARGASADQDGAEARRHDGGARGGDPLQRRRLRRSQWHDRAFGRDRGPGPYKIPHVKVDAYAIYTNRPNAVPFRGLAISQVAWAYECHTDELARRLGRDPLEFRKQNLLHDHDPYATGEELEDVHFTELLEDAARGIDYGGPLPTPSGPEKVVGRGLSVIIKHMGSNPATTQLEIRLDADGTISVLSSTVDIGQGSRAVLAREGAGAGHPGDDGAGTVYGYEPDTAGSGDQL